MLTISVKNFGPIAEGSVDLKPLTIFVGPSNTGKSYMATAVYAVMRAASRDFDGKWGLDSRQANPWVRAASWYEGQISGEALASLKKWVRQQIGNSSSIAHTHLSSLPNDIFRWLQESSVQQLDYLRRDIFDILGDIHGGSASFLKLGSDPDKFNLLVDQDYPTVGIEIRGPDTSGPSSEIDISNSYLPEFPFTSPSIMYGTEDNKWLWVEIANYLVSVATKSVLGKFPAHSYYLPAGRSGIMQGHRLLSSEMVHQASLIGIRELKVPAMPAISAEFLSHLIRLHRNLRVLESKGALDLATHFIETSVLRGKIDLDESAGLPFPNIAYETKEGQFAIDRTSSMVSELAPLILFLKYLVRPGDLLVLEEPESHLHPAAQRQLARGIVRLVNAGVKVLITTHSDIFVSQVNNLLALRQASPELIEQGGFDPEDFLEPDQVGAYLFRHSREQEGCETVPLEIDPDTGIDEDEFAAVFESIYDESIALQRDRD